MVDPPYAIEPLLEEAARRDVRIVRVIETHTHADHVSGHGRLALEHGIPVSIHPVAAVDYPARPAPGRRRDHRRQRDAALHPHAGPPARALLPRGRRPHARRRAWLLLTGDSLFVGDTARPDLAVGAEEGAEGLFHSLQRLLELARRRRGLPRPRGGLAVREGHELEGAPPRSASSGASTRCSRLGAVDAFVAESAGIGAPKPPNLGRIVDVNRGPFVGALPAPRKSSPPHLTAPSCSTCAPSPPSPPATCRVPSACPSAGRASRPRRFRARRRAPDRRPRRLARRGRAGDPRAQLRRVLSTSPGFVLGGGAETMAPVAVDELDDARRRRTPWSSRRPRARRARARGRSPGAANIPYRLSWTRRRAARRARS